MINVYVYICIGVHYCIIVLYIYILKYIIIDITSVPKGDTSECALYIILCCKTVIEYIKIYEHSSS